VKNEPCNLREWFTERGRLLTCGRPGRGYYPAGRLPQGGVPDDILREWVDGIGIALLGADQVVVLVDSGGATRTGCVRKALGHPNRRLRTKGPGGNKVAISADDASRLAALLVGHRHPACSLLAPGDPGASPPESRQPYSDQGPNGRIGRRCRPCRRYTPKGRRSSVKICFRPSRSATPRTETAQNPGFRVPFALATSSSVG